MGLTVVTGANRGIGFQLARQLMERGETVVALVRSSSPALDSLGVEVIADVDLTSDDLAPVTDAVGDRSVKLLVNNAGLMRPTSLDALELEPMRQQYEVNTLGPLKLTAALLGNLGAGSKVVHITSRMGSITDNTSGGHYGYRMSKAALNMAMKSMSVDLAPRGVSVCVLHPGYVRTGMTGQNGYIDADESAAGLIARMDALCPENSGGFWHQNGEPLPW